MLTSHKTSNIRLFIFLLLLLNACSDNNNPKQEGPGKENAYFREVKQETKVSKFFIQLALNTFGFGDYAEEVKGNIALYSIGYNTEYPSGNNIVASGVYIIPEKFNKNFPVVIYTHGTQYENEAPSLSVEQNNLTASKELMLCSAMAAVLNCVVLMPDYIGYGSSNYIQHPYIHKESLGKASLDFISSYAEYITDSIGLDAFNPGIFITGYSEGGYAAVALQEKIEKSTDMEFKVIKTVAGSGPYDNVAIARTFFFTDDEMNKKTIASFLWTLDMYKKDYRYSKDYSDIYSENNYHVFRDNNWQLGYLKPENYLLDFNPSILFKPEFISGVLERTDTELNHILKENSLTDFIPADSLIFVYGTDDTWVYPENTINAYKAMKEKGGKVIKYEISGGTHESTILPFVEIMLEKYFLALDNIESKAETIYARSRKMQ